MPLAACGNEATFEFASIGQTAPLSGHSNEKFCGMTTAFFGRMIGWKTTHPIGRSQGDSTEIVIQSTIVLAGISGYVRGHSG
jgi:hypothetical protein